MPNFIDIEASGLHFDSYPIEIAINLEGKIHSWLIRPEPQWTYWSTDAEAFHGISRPLLETEGWSAKEVTKMLNEFLAGTDGLVYSDACAWDEDWINTLFHASDQCREFHILPLNDLLSAREWTRFQLDLATLKQSGRYRHHRAAGDVAMIYEAWRSATDA